MRDIGRKVLATLALALWAFPVAWAASRRLSGSRM